MEQKKSVERQRELRERRYAAGFRMCGEWIHVSDFPEFKEFAKKLRKRRFEEMEKGVVK